MLSLIASTLLLACKTPPVGSPPGLVINEVLSYNASAWTDPAVAPGETCPEHDDAVELYNAGTDSIALSGWTLADESGDELVLPDVRLRPGEYAIVVADGSPEQGPWHAPFGVSRSGERLTLRDPKGIQVDQIVVPALSVDESYGRNGDGGPVWRTQEPSIGLSNEPPPNDPCFAVPMGFDDHTVPCLTTEQGFSALAGSRTGLSVVKFDVLNFQRNNAHVVFLDGRFYDFHDQWYIFRMLNGQLVEGEDRFSPFDGNFQTMAEITDWASQVDLESLFPSDFLWLSPTGRLTSFRYYDLALTRPRSLGAGTLLRIPSLGEDNGPAWAFELEYADDITYGELVVYFEALQRHLMPNMARDLHWLVRSPAQEALAVRMADEGLRYGDHVLRYDALSPPGTVDVYHPGTVAGRVRIIRAGEALDADPTDILVLEDIPDALPPCAALLTSVAQTPLSHVALLAESRGIPNVHVAGIATSPQWDNWARSRSKVAIRATAPGSFEVVPIDEDTYALWLALQVPSAPALEPVDGSGLEAVVDLDDLGTEDVSEARRTLGGKAAGFVVLQAAEIEVPPDAVAVSVQPYQAHVEALGFVQPLLAATEFGHPGDSRGRYLLLQGSEGYEELYDLPGDAAYQAGLLARYQPGTMLGDLLRDGGAVGRFASTPIDASILAPIETALTTRFTGYAGAQGLRIRSSSNVEDLEGFVGAGLYLSDTAMPFDAASEQTIAQALQAVWGSYWGVEAFEERHAAKIPHEYGAMGLLVHASFDDTLELANGVMTATRLPDGRTEVVVNAQVGAISVANPPVDSCVPILPEVAIVTEGSDPLRVRRSTELPGEDLLDDGVLWELHDMARRVVDTWQALENEQLPPAHQRTVLVLDLEFRWVDEGWPVVDPAQPFPERRVVKQARSLEPSVARLPEEVQDLPFPRDLLARARVVSDFSCAGATERLVVHEATTDPAQGPDMGYAIDPFVAGLTLNGVPFDHGDFVAATHHDEVLLVTMTPEATSRTGITRIELDQDTLTVTDGGLAREQGVACVTEVRWASSDTFLDGLF